MNDEFKIGDWVRVTKSVDDPKFDNNRSYQIARLGWAFVKLSGLEWLYFPYENLVRENPFLTKIREARNKMPAKPPTDEPSI
ncbi:hypothetical protein [Spirosoma oryzae]|uniref:hypothetical protein n=1 Tax=Spirosoma oryzae TaxID=1469603 RepID=UPI0011B24109|nr:hypothetical protein [Spirosoma oryzae]